MSVGFIGNNYQSSVDVNNNGSRLELSLQNVLDRYDVSRTDLDRLGSSAFYNTYDITSRQHYNAYNAEAVSGWAESWYAEYRAVLQMRADSLQKKLQASYNRVLEKSVYTELESNRDSVFAPYANRTDSLTAINMTGPISEVLLRDVDVPTAIADPTPPVDPTVFTTLDAYLLSYVEPADPAATPAIVGGPKPIVQTDPSLFSDQNATLNASQYQAFHDAITDAYKDAGIPQPPITPADQAASKDIADVAISQLISTMKPVTQNPGSGPITVNVSNVITAFGVKSPLQLGGLPTGNIPQPTPSASPVTAYQTWNSALDAGNGNFGPAGSFSFAENQIPSTGSPGATFAGNGYQASWLGSMSFTVNNAAPYSDPQKLLNTPAIITAPIAFGTVTIPAGGVASPSGTVGILNPAQSPATYFDGAMYASSSGATAGNYFAENELIVSPLSAANTHSFYLDDLGPTLAADSDWGATIEQHIMNRFKNNRLVDSNGVAITELPPKNGLMVFKTRYPQSWYVSGDPRLGITGQPGLAPDNSAGWIASTAANAQDYVGREVVVGTSGAPVIQGWMSGTGLYSVIRGAVTGIVLGVKVSTLPPDPTLPPPAAGSYTYDGGGAGDYYDKSIGDAASSEGGTIANNKSNVRDVAPMFGGGYDPNITDLFTGLPADVRDTLLKDPTVVADLTGALSDISKSFVGRQYDDIIKGNGYWGKYNSVDAAAIVGISFPISFTASPLKGLVETEKAVDKAASSYTMAGSNGLAGLITDSTFMAMGIGPDLNLGHASAISEGLLKYGTIGLGSFALNIPIPIPPPINITLWVGGKGSATRDVVTETIVDFFSQIKTLMVEAMQTQAYSASSGTVFDTYASKGENHFSNLGFVEGLRKVNITMMGVEIPIGKMVSSLIKGDGSGGTSGIASLPAPIGLGIDPALASDAYTETLNKANEGERMFEVKHGVQTPETRETDTGAFFATQSFLSQFSMQNMESNYWVGTQQNEELVDTDFLRSLSSVGTMFLNTLQTLLQMIGGSTNSGAVEKALSAAKDLVLEKDKINLWYNLFFKDQNVENKMNNIAQLAVANPKAAIEIVKGAINSPTAFEVPVDPTKGVLINMSPATVGALIGGQVVKSKFKSEAYDYLESDHKPFEGDSDFNYPEPPTSMIGSILSMTGSSLADLFKANVPPNIMEGYAATMRFTSKTAGAGPIEQMSIADFNPNPAAANFETANGIGPRALAGRTPGAAGLWTDTPLGDINEVYVGSRKVVFTDLENGFNTFDAAALKANKITDTGATAATGASQITGIDPLTGRLYGQDVVTNSTTQRQTFASVQRYIGADTRAYGRRYDGGEAPTFESFNTNIYTSAGGSYRYDRKNEYSLKFTTKASGKALDLQGAQALNPFIGGFIKMADIEKNKHDSVLMNYDDIDRANKIRWDTIKDSLGNVVASNQSATAALAVRKTGATLENTKNIIAYNADDQQFGGASDGTMNELNKTLYEHMHLRADGQNLSLFKEYKDVFNMGFMKNIFISGQSYHPSGGGISSSIEIRYDPFGGAGIDKVQTDSRESYDSVSNNVLFDPYNSITLQKTRGKASVYLNNYFASKKRSSSK